jgi:hypothetical protein
MILPMLESITKTNLLDKDTNPVKVLLNAIAGNISQNAKTFATGRIFIVDYKKRSKNNKINSRF